jgi:hypothetical protein
MPNGYGEPVADMVAESLIVAAKLMVWDVHDALGAKLLGTPATPLLQHQAQQIADSVVASWKRYAKQLDRDDFKVAVTQEAHDALAIKPSDVLADALLGRSVPPYIRNRSQRCEAAGLTRPSTCPVPPSGPGACRQGKWRGQCPRRRESFSATNCQFGS